MNQEPEFCQGCQAPKAYDVVRKLKDPRIWGLDLDLAGDLESAPVRGVEGWAL